MRRGGYIGEFDWTDFEISLLKTAYASTDGPVNLSLLASDIGKNKTNVCRKARSLGLTNQRRKKVLERKRTTKYETIAEARAATAAATKARLAKHHPRGALGMRHSDESKMVISQKSSQRWKSMTKDQRDELIFKRVKSKRDKGIPFANPRGSWKAEWREIGQQRCFFRSRWEANYARYLEWLRSIGHIQAWQHEAHTFWFEGIKRGCVSYLPDFKVTNNNGSIHWHEVKGWMDARSKTVLRRMAKYHPNEKIILIKERQYMEIKKKVSRLIPQWEIDSRGR